MAYVVFDIDGVLADSAYRTGPFRTTPKGDYSPCLNDLPLPLHHLFEPIRAAGWEIVIITGRSEAGRLHTVQWFSQNGLTPDLLLMRPDDVAGVDRWKLDAIRNLILRDGDPLLIFEDSPRICLSLRAARLPIVAVHSGHYTWPTC